MGRATSLRRKRTGNCSFQKVGPKNPNSALRDKTEMGGPLFFGLPEPQFGRLNGEGPGCQGFTRGRKAFCAPRSWGSLSKKAPFVPRRSHRRVRWFSMAPGCISQRYKKSVAHDPAHLLNAVRVLQPLCAAQSKVENRGVGGPTRSVQRQNGGTPPRDRIRNRRAKRAENFSR